MWVCDVLPTSLTFGRMPDCVWAIPGCMRASRQLSTYPSPTFWSHARLCLSRSGCRWETEVHWVGYFNPLGCMPDYACAMGCCMRESWRFAAHLSWPSWSHARLDDWVERLKEWQEQGIKEIDFFIHQNIEKESPLLSAYFIKQLNAKLGCELKIPNEDNGTLF